MICLFIFFIGLLNIVHSYNNLTPMNYITDNILLCKNCKNFIPPENLENIETGKCGLFYNINFISGKKDYLCASTARASQSNCGKSGMQYDEKRKYVKKQKTE